MVDLMNSFILTLLGVMGALVVNFADEESGKLAETLLGIFIVVVCIVSLIWSEIL